MAENKRFYWLKLKRDFFKRHDIQVVENMPNGKDYVLFYLKLLLESIDHEGQLRFSETIPYDENMLSAVTNTNVDIVRTALKIFSELQMIEFWEDRTLYMREVEKMLGSETSWAEKKRLYRETKKALPCEQAEDKPRTSEDNVRQEIEIEKENKSKSKNTNKAAKPTYEAILAEVENEDLRNCFAEYVKMRMLIKAPMTDRALQMLITKVKTLEPKSVERQKSLLETAIINNWKSVYPLRDEPKKKENPRNPKAQTKSDGFMDELQSMYDDLMEDEE